MLAKVMSAAVSGIDALPVTVEAASSSGWSFSMVGLPDTAVKESYERIRTAMEQAGVEFHITGRVYSTDLTGAPEIKNGSVRYVHESGAIYEYAPVLRDGELLYTNRCLINYILPEGTSIEEEEK